MAKRNETASFCVLVALVVVVILAAQAKSAVAGSYSYSYTSAMQETVNEVVQKAMNGYPGVGAALIRLLFHDCWVNGCDGSVLLDSTPYNSTAGTEKAAGVNIGLGGFEVIDAIKARLGDAGVSCADAVVFAAREATIILSHGTITYDVVGGRSDGVFSSAEYANAILPLSTFDFKQLKDNFAAKNFTQEELVVLSGAHCVGVAHYTSFQDRLLPTAVNQIDTNYQIALNVRALAGGSKTQNPTEKNNIRDMDKLFRDLSHYNASGVNTSATGTLDNSYYTANLQNMVLFKSDWELTQDGRANADLNEYKKDAAKWNLLFGNAMAKLSNLKAEGTRFEARKNCSITNQKYYE